MYQFSCLRTVPVDLINDLFKGMKCFRSGFIYEIKPVIDVQDRRMDGEQTRLIEEQENVVYDLRGTVCPSD